MFSGALTSPRRARTWRRSILAEAQHSSFAAAAPFSFHCAARVQKLRPNQRATLLPTAIQCGSTIRREIRYSVIEQRSTTVGRDRFARASRHSASFTPKQHP